jgi:MFS family permease
MTGGYVLESGYLHKKIKAVYALLFGGMGAYAPFINLYLSKSLGISTGYIGTLGGIGSCISLIAQPLWCKRADMKGQKQTLAPALILSALGLLFYSTVRHPSSIILAVTLFTAANCGVMPILDSSSMQAIRAAGGRIAFADIRLWGSFGFVVTTALSGYIYMRAGTLTPVFSAYAGALFILAILMLANGTKDSSRLQPTDTKPDKQGTKTNALRHIWSSPTARTLLVACFLHQVTTVSGNAYIGIYTAKLGGSYFEVGLMSSIAAMVEIPVAVGLGYLSRRISVGRVLAGAFILNSLRWGLVSLTHNPSILLALQMLGGAVFISYYTSSVTLIDEYSPKDSKSGGQSVFWLSTSVLASLIGNPLGGAVYDKFGPNVFYLTIAATGLLASGVWGAQILKLNRQTIHAAH